jgi:TrpR family transcriptional regulator, trp operon repressor
MTRDGNLLDVFTQISSRPEMAAFLSEILTDKEWETMSLRWSLMQMLRDGHTQREVAKKLGVSLCKITRGSKIIQDPSSISGKYLRQEQSDL